MKKLILLIGLIFCINYVNAGYIEYKSLTKTTRYEGIGAKEQYGYILNHEGVNSLEGGNGGKLIFNDTDIKKINGEFAYKDTMRFKLFVPAGATFLSFGFQAKLNGDYGATINYIANNKKEFVLKYEPSEKYSKDIGTGTNRFNIQIVGGTRRMNLENPPSGWYFIDLYGYNSITKSGYYNNVDMTIDYKVDIDKKSVDFLNWIDNNSNFKLDGDPYLNTKVNKKYLDAYTGKEKIFDIKTDYDPTKIISCKQQTNQKNYKLNNLNLKNIILNIGEKIVKKSDDNKLKKLVKVLEKINGKNDKQKGIVNLLKDYFECESK